MLAGWPRQEGRFGVFGVVNGNGGIEDGDYGGDYGDLLNPLIERARCQPQIRGITGIT